MHFDTLQAWLNWQEGLHPKVIDLGLDRAARVYQALNPKAIKPLTITVAGTNGKGSCIAFLEAIYRAEGYRVGAYTSPHILNYNERIKINAEQVDDAVICAAFERIESVRDNVSLSYFEFSTLAALDIFWRAEVDIQLLEVGLGGRLDAVNIIDADVTLVSSISIDHCDWLGATREAIGKEKAGVFRAGIPAIVGDPDPPDSLIQTALEKQAQLACFGKDFGFRVDQDSWDWFTEAVHLKQLPLPALKGEHQFRNASAILLAIHLLQEKLPVNSAAIRKGLSELHLNGRYQFLPGKVPVLLDVGHNPEAVQALANYVQQTFPEHQLYAVFSMMKDKDIANVIEIMRPQVKHWYVSPLQNPRIASEQMMKTAFAENAVNNVSFGFSNFEETYAAVQADVKAGDLILVFGSFFLISEFLAAFETHE